MTKMITCPTDESTDTLPLISKNLGGGAMKNLGGGAGPAMMLGGGA